MLRIAIVCVVFLMIYGEIKVITHYLVNIPLYIFSIECMWRFERSSSRMQNRWFSMYMVNIKRILLITNGGNFNFFFYLIKNYSGFGCKSEYRYLTKKECTDALKVNIKKKFSKKIIIKSWTECSNKKLFFFRYFFIKFSVSFSYFHSLVFLCICIYAARFFDLPQLFNIHMILFIFSKREEPVTFVLEHHAWMVAYARRYRLIPVLNANVKVFEIQF